MAERNRLVLVSGATGKQGGAIAHELLKAGWRVLAMARKPQGEPARALAAAGAEVVTADLDDENSTRRALDAVGYDVNIAGTAAEFDVRPTPLREWAPQQKRD